jgi:alcohol dehydrogenase (cytochrome c)
MMAGTPAVTRKSAVAIGLILSATAFTAALPAAAQTPDLKSLGADPDQWVMPAKNWSSTRYSALDQINTGNVGQLRLAWTFSDGIDKGQEAAPLVVGNTMYVVTPFPNKLIALDATTGDLEWTYAPPANLAAQGVACCDVVNRGAAYDNGKLFFNTLDDYTVAVDARTGKEIWHTQLGEITAGETMTMAPLVARGKVFVGNSGGEMGIRGWLTALDENTGKIVWRAYNTGPDKDVLIGPGFKPYYKWMQGKDLGVKTWPADKWRIGGAGVWGWLSYDPELNQIYYGSGNPGPWNSNQRPGDNLWAATIFARDADTGAAKWAFQTSPHDLWDHDSVNELVLLDLEIDGKLRKVMVRPGRNGYMMVIDRETGQLLSADPYDTVTAYKGYDLKTGRIIPDKALDPTVNTVVHDVCPASPGAKDWQPSAWSPETKLLYVPHQHLCMDFMTSQVGYIAGTPYVGATVDMYAGPGNGYRGEMMAWDPVARKKVWAIHERFPVWSGTVATAGNVVFYGTMDRWFKAVDAKTGKLLWQFRAPSGIIGQPIVYKGSDGREYVAILSGVGGWPGAVANAELDPRLRNGALGFTGAMQDLPAYTAAGDVLLVFALPSSNGAAAARPVPTPAPEPAATPTPAPAAPKPAAPAPAATPPAPAAAAPSAPAGGGNAG